MGRRQLLFAVLVADLWLCWMKAFCRGPVHTIVEYSQILNSIKHKEVNFQALTYWLVVPATRNTIPS
jgi:hypothetical protein